MRTLRALALALEITPGLLADGIGPETEKPLVLTRDRLERVAQAVAAGKPLANAEENQLAQGVARLVKGRLRAAGHKNKGLSLRVFKKTEEPLALYRPEEIQSLVERISEKAEAYK